MPRLPRARTCEGFSNDWRNNGDWDWVAEGNPELLGDLAARIAFFFQQPLDFTLTDPETTFRKVRLLSHAAVYLNTLAVTEFGGRIGQLREEGLVEQIVGAAFQTYEGTDPHPGPFDKAAMLLRGVTQGHPFTDGNKRTGWLLAAYFLDCIGYTQPSELDEDSVVSFCLAVSSGEIRDLDKIARRLADFWL